MLWVMAKTDAELVAATLEGDPQAFEEIVNRYQKLVFNIIYHYLGHKNEVEDLAQEVFLKVFSSLESFDQGRALQPWICRITANCCLDELRKPRYRRLILFSDLSEEEEERLEYFFEQFTRGDGLTQVEAEKSFELLHKVMSKLGEKDKMAFVLRELQGLSYAEIAQALKTSELGARIRVSRSRKKLQEEFGKILYGKSKVKK